MHWKYGICSKIYIEVAGDDLLKSVRRYEENALNAVYFT